MFHPDGTVIDTFPSALVTRTLPDDWLVVDNGLVADVLLVVDVVEVGDLLQPAREIIIEESRVTVKRADIIILSCFI